MTSTTQQEQRRWRRNYREWQERKGREGEGERDGDSSSSSSSTSSAFIFFSGTQLC